MFRTQDKNASITAYSPLCAGNYDTTTNSPPSPLPPPRNSHLEIPPSANKSPLPPYEGSSQSLSVQVEEESGHGRTLCPLWVGGGGYYRYGSGGVVGERYCAEPVSPRVLWELV
jgi:hypothetical protein